MSGKQGQGVTRRTFLTGATAGVAAASMTGGRAKAKGAGREDKVRIGIVGGGFGASFQWHLHPDCEVAAVCDIQETPLNLLKEVYKCDAGYKSFREMLGHPGLNAVGVYTPAPLHVWMATEAMRAGKHAISAVPAGMSAEELEQLLECVRTTGMKYMMAETSYYRAPAIACRELARDGAFGTIAYSESEYHHEGLMDLFYDERGLPTWRLGLPPMHYPTHCTGMIIPVTGERLTEVMAIGWGDGHEVLQTNLYENPFWNTNAFFKTSGGHSARVSVCWHVAAGNTERAAFYGDHMSYIMARPEGSANVICRIGKGPKAVLDKNGYPQGAVNRERHKVPDYFERLPEPMRVPCGHGNSHTFLTHEFVSAIIEDRNPTVDVYEAVAYTMPGIVAHQSALRGGEVLKIKDYG